MACPVDATGEVSAAVVGYAGQVVFATEKP
jgi:hypothetical protein